MKCVQFSFRISPELRAEAQALADKEGRSLASIVVSALLMYLSRGD